MMRYSCLALCWMLAGCASSRALPVQPAPDGVAGTYDLQICRGPCDPRRPETEIVRGTLVLESERYPLSALPAGAVSYLERMDFELTVIDTERAPNGCFVLARTGEARTYAGTTTVGVTRWEADSVGILRLPLFHSPDAGYVARIAVEGREVRGRGRSWGVGDARVDFPMDSIYGRRVGPPDRRICIRAAEAAAEAMARRSGI